MKTCLSSRSIIIASLSPYVLLGIPYAIALVLFYTAPKQMFVFCRIQKIDAGIGNLFVLLSFVTFIIAILLGTVLGEIAVRHRQPYTHGHIYRKKLLFLLLPAAGMTLIACLLESVIFWRLVMLTGGWKKFLFLISNESFITIAKQFKSAAKIRGFTTFVFLGTSASTLAGYVAGHATGRDRIALYLSIVLAVTYSVFTLPRASILCERLALLVPVTCFGAAYICARLGASNPPRLSSLLVLACVILLTFIAIWISSVTTRPIREYKKSPKSFEQIMGKGSVPQSPKDVLKYALFRLGAYFFTSINNQAHLVTHLKERTGGYHSFKWAYRGFAILSEKWRPVLREEEELLRKLPQMHPEYNVFGSAGYLFADYGWWALICIASIGLLTGVLYIAAIKGTLWGGLIYPLFIPPMIDAYRTHMWGSSRFAIPFLFNLLLILLYTLCKSDRITTSQHYSTNNSANMRLV